MQWGLKASFGTFVWLLDFNAQTAILRLLYSKRPASGWLTLEFNDDLHCVFAAFKPYKQNNDLLKQYKKY